MNLAQSLLKTTPHGVGCAAGVTATKGFCGQEPPSLSLRWLHSLPLSSLCTDRSSECLSAIEQTDTEDLASPPLPPGSAKSQKAKGGLLGGTFPGGLTPLYLIKNVILEQVACVAGHLGQALSPPPPGLAAPAWPHHWPPACGRLWHPAPCPKECPVGWGVRAPLACRNRMPLGGPGKPPF